MLSAENGFCRLKCSFLSSILLPPALCRPERPQKSPSPPATPLSTILPLHSVLALNPTHPEIISSVIHVYCDRFRTDSGYKACLNRTVVYLITDLQSQTLTKAKQTVYKATRTSELLIRGGRKHNPFLSKLITRELLPSMVSSL